VHIAVHVDSIFGEMNIQLFFHSQTRTLIAIFHKNSARSRFESIRLDGDDQSAREDQLLRKTCGGISESWRHGHHEQHQHWHNCAGDGEAPRVLMLGLLGKNRWWSVYIQMFGGFCDGVFNHRRRCSIVYFCLNWFTIGLTSYQVQKGELSEEKNDLHHQASGMPQSKEWMARYSALDACSLQNGYRIFISNWRPV